MNRTQKKCVLASTGFHLSLLLVLFVGPAFLSSKEQAENRPLIDFIPLKTIDEALSGGGNPNARPPQAPPPAPAPPKPAVQPPAARTQPVEQPEPLKPAQPPPDSFNIKPARKLPAVNVTPVTRRSNSQISKSTSAQTSDSTTKARQAQLAQATAAITQGIREGLSSSTDVEMPGPGGGGVPYANFKDAVKKIYTDAWVVPPEVTDDSATATASVTIARDGTVLEARIISRSGNDLADQSVEAVLRRVTYAAPLPDDTKESKRTVTIRFNVKAKLLG